MYIQKLREIVPSRNYNTVGVCNQIKLLIFTVLVLGCLTFLKLLLPLYISLIFLRTVS